MTPSESSVSESAPSRPSSVRHAEVVDRLVALWGTMASNWGINRTMAQVYSRNRHHTQDLHSRIGTP